MSSTEMEFRERLDSKENDDEVPAHLNPKTLNEREFYYLLMKSNRTVSDVETFNHMCCIESNIRIEQNIYFMDADQFQQEVGCWWFLESWY